VTANPLTIDCGRLVLFGATGDLARRMLWPSLYALDRDGLLPADFRLVGAAHSRWSVDDFRARVRDAVRSSANAALYDEGAFARFAARIGYVAVDAVAPGGLAPLASEPDHADARPTAFYLSTAPQLFAPICRALAASGLVRRTDRLVVEKPIGSDVASARETNAAIAAAFDEDHVYRIDHYLGKEAVQNLLALRFANSIFEPLWNAHNVEHVQITVAETVGVEGRWGYYDGAGALRDMVQSHMLQLLCLVAMEPPARFEPSAVRNEKVKVLWSLRPIAAAEVATNSVTGQYTAGFGGNGAVPGYREEEGANATSDTETFVALRAGVDNWRWAGVPFYLRTGKRMQKRLSEVVIQFKPTPHDIFADLGASLAANRLLIRLQPDENIALTLMHKAPGLHGIRLNEVGLDLSLGRAFAGARRRIAYERLLLDVLQGQSALFVRADEIEAAWQWIDGIVRGWRATGQQPRPYAAGSWGPSAAIGLPERHGHSWHE
jgi:glucose-6-phosphate 1-dehydrogenase